MTLPIKSLSCPLQVCQRLPGKGEDAPQALKAIRHASFHICTLCPRLQTVCFDVTAFCNASCCSATSPVRQEFRHMMPSSGRTVRRVHILLSHQLLCVVEQSDVMGS